MLYIEVFLAIVSLACWALRAKLKILNQDLGYSFCGGATLRPESLSDGVCTASNNDLLFSLLLHFSNGHLQLNNVHGYPPQKLAHAVLYSFLVDLWSFSRTYPLW
jgi:hypothetical protein